MGARSKNKTAEAIGALAAEADSIEVTSNSRTIILDSGKLDKLKEHLDKVANKRPEVIREASIVDYSKLNVTYTVEIPNGVDTTAKKCSAPIHDDLRNAFAKLVDHLGRLCFQPLTEHNPLYEKNKEVPALICPIHCYGFKITGNEGNEKITLYGSRTLPNAKSIALTSPAQRLDGDLYDYEFSDDLSEIIQECIGEVELYLFEGKHAPDLQWSLFPDSEYPEVGEEDDPGYQTTDKSEGGVN